ncbi:MAG: Hsp20/alpha crystallin family protein [Erysipelotrichaceae bacterium]|nr:Hsp20/alpha crystallin family protein [Erysipelotrichaceae bacterium]MBQ4342952.1 Hsp20/alpha crystallin family protein [Erysipelotrichaceae bacterium]
MKFVPRRMSLFDDRFEDFFKDPWFVQPAVNAMKTDIIEKDGNFLLNIEMPGVKKEDITVSLEKGTLCVQASRNAAKEEQDASGNVIRRERSTGTFTRSFYVGDEVSEQDIKAKFDNGELQLVIPNLSARQIETKKMISIE